MIVLDGIAKRFGETRALGGLDLTVGPGDVLGLLGPNGAGKTTLVRVLATLLPPDAGRGTVAGFDLVRQAAHVRSSIGLAGQSAAVDELLTGRENAELVGRLYGLGPAERRRRADEVLERFDLAGVAARRAGTYSGGMRRRLDLAVTLVGRPPVLLLDEPTAGLDPRGRAEVWRFVDGLAAGGTTVVLTSQYLEEVERLADRIAVLDHGRVIAEGAADELRALVGGDVLEVRVADVADVGAGRRALAGLGELAGAAPQVDRDGGRITVPARGGTRALVAAGRRLEDAGVALADLGIRRPSLDDVFFTLTGGAADADPDARGPAATTEPAGPAGPAEPAAGPARPPLPPRPPTRGTPRRPRPHVASDIAAIAGRNLTRLARTPQLVFFAAVQPVLFVLGLPAIFGGVVESASGGDYMQFLIPGVLVMHVMLAAGSSGVGLAEDMQAGVVDRFRSLPIARSAVVVGRTLADLARNTGTALVMLAAGVALGYRLGGSPAEGLAALALALLLGYAFTWVFVSVGLAVKDVQAAQFAGFAPVLPLTFLSGAWIPVDTMADGVQGFARHQPVNVTIEAVRSLAAGAPDAGRVAQSLAWSLGIAAVFAVLAVRQYRTAVI